MTSAAPSWRRLNLRKNVVFAIGEFAITMALVFLSYRLVILQGGLEAVGVWASLYAWINLIRLGDVGMAGSIARFLALWDVSEARDQVCAHAETALVTNIAQFGVLALLCWAVLSPFAGAVAGADHAAEAGAALPYMAAAFFLLNVAGTVQGILQGLHLGYRRSQLSVLGTALQLAAAVALVPRYGLVGLALAQSLQHLAVAGLGWAAARRAMGGGFWRVRFDRAAFRTMLGYSLEAQVLNVANGLIEPASKMLVGHFGGMATLALFELAFKTVLLPRNLVGSGVSAAVPALSALYLGDRDALRRLYARMVRLATLSMGAAALALVALAPLPSQLWLGRVDETYRLYVSWLAAGFFFNAAAMPAYLVGMAAGDMRKTIVVTLIMLACLVTVGYMLGLGFGGDGAVAASAGTIGLCGVLVWRCNRTLIANPIPPR